MNPSVACAIDNQDPDNCIKPKRQERVEIIELSYSSLCQPIVRVFGFRQMSHRACTLIDVVALALE
ncbi:beta-N-acetylhexosaminidase [Anopheles sinensis]|uniref:Beta-N-acetylhexosaminidase n=1 Tax=Anopheles sinensis TaxID=74873 RepID=A0A084VZQ6_ANOSI|nr:beta-N-acetylhexosaminidase [Anopheles sinensis]